MPIHPVVSRSQVRPLDPPLLQRPGRMRLSKFPNRTSEIVELGLAATWSVTESETVTAQSASITKIETFAVRETSRNVRGCCVIKNLPKN